MTLIQGYVEALLDGVTNDPDQQKKYLKLIHSRALGLNRLIADLFELSKLEARQIGFHLKEVSIRRLIEYVNGRYETEVAGAGLRYTLHMDQLEGYEQCVLRIDIDRIDQVLTNIIYNAIKHTPAGGDIRLIFRMDGRQRLQVEIADTGGGIEPGDIPYVFERFYKKDKSRNTFGRGSGLGLAIAKEIIEFHGGQIGVKSEAGKGSTFYFKLPVYDEENL
jgi:signal transduction histidine kinase